MWALSRLRARSRMPPPRSLRRCAGSSGTLGRSTAPIGLRGMRRGAGMKTANVTGNHADSLFDNIPTELKQRRQWVAFKRGQLKATGKRDEFPYDRKTGELAKVNDSETWGTFDEAVRASLLRGGFDGIGYVFSEDDPYTGADLDGCRDPQT